MNNDLANNPKLSGIAPEKLELLQRLAQQGNDLPLSDLIPFLMTTVNREKEKGLSFSKEEISAILEAVRSGKSPQETARLDQILRMMKMIR